MIRQIVNTLLFKFKNRTCRTGKQITISYRTKVGNNCMLRDHCSLSKDTILGDNVIIGEYSKLRLIRVGNNSIIEGGVKIVGPGNGAITIGKESYIGVNNVLDTSNNIIIGDFVHIAGPSTGLWCHSSWQMCLNSIPVLDKNRDKYRPTAPVIIESNVYIGGNCTIYPGVTIRHHSIVAPNSAISEDVEPYTLVGGVPAKLIKKIDDKYLKK